MFSLSKLRKIKEEGRHLCLSYRTVISIFMGPEESMRIQSNLGSTIAMAFDECVENPAEYRLCQKLLRAHRALAVRAARRRWPA